MDGYERDGHTKYSLKVHMIFVTKYRKPIFRDVNMANDIKQFLYEAACAHGCVMEQRETDIDHVHILIRYAARNSVADIARYLKQSSTYHLWRRYREALSRQYWKRKILWSEGYFACSIGQVSQETIAKYIENQG